MEEDNIKHEWEREYDENIDRLIRDQEEMEHIKINPKTMTKEETQIILEKLHEIREKLDTLLSLEAAMRDLPSDDEVFRSLNSGLNDNKK